jgi:protein-disulfide isomerase
MVTRILTVVLFILAIIATAAITIIVSDKQESGSGAVVSEADLGKAIGDYIENNPESIVQAFIKSQAKQAELEDKNAESKISENKDKLEGDKRSPFAGNPNGDVTIITFHDYNCGYCHKVAPDIDQILKEDTNVKFIMKDFPILGDLSHEKAKASTAVFNIAPDKWYGFYKEMLTNAPRNSDQIVALVEKLGISKDQFNAEIAKPEIENKLQENLALGQQIGVRGTPAFVINGEFIKGAVGIDVFKEKIKAARERAKAK